MTTTTVFSPVTNADISVPTGMLGRALEVAERKRSAYAADLTCCRNDAERARINATVAQYDGLIANLRAACAETQP
jgi:hypothetical protein